MRNVYPGVNIVYYGNQDQLEFDFVVAPGASHRAIELAFDSSTDIALDEKGNLVGPGDLRAQTKRVFENLSRALAAVGAGFEDVVKMTYYVVGYRAEQLPVIREVRSEYLPRNNPPASTLVGVESLFMDGVLIEVEAIAVVS